MAHREQTRPFAQEVQYIFFVMHNNVYFIREAALSLELSGHIIWGEFFKGFFKELQKKRFFLCQEEYYIPCLKKKL